MRPDAATASNGTPQGHPIGKRPRHQRDGEGPARDPGRDRRQLGGLDILVNNAAFQQHVDDILDLTDEHFDLTLKTNLYGYFYMARAAVPHLNTGSVTSIEGSGELLDYSMTKGGIHAFSRSPRILIPRGIRVDTVAPGPV